ncbi:phosphotransferase enzyme family protein [Cucumibacter marinus]|uniref:phosphotransferase enzyme family protein n=1 Tax=Cucumibacter marinus TaxID=1121252 RepID=UPI000405B091|nr:phosphotransferase [Cucumibacter marinus]
MTDHVNPTAPSTAAIAAAGIDMEVLSAALANWPDFGEAKLEPLHISENASFLVRRGGDPVAVLRVGRPGYQSLPATRSEIEFMTTLGAQTGIAVPSPIAGVRGEVVREIDVSGRADDARPAVMFAFEHGSPVGADGSTPAVFEELGTMAARAHRFVTKWKRPIGFERPELWTDIAGPQHTGWGDWRIAADMDAEAVSATERALTVMAQRLDAYGRGPDRCGLIHADMHGANVMQRPDGQGLLLIDFDDSGFCWFGYDFAAAISFIETWPRAGDLREAWLNGYTRHRAFSRDDIAELDSFVLLRRLALQGWITTHGGTPLADRFGTGFAEGTMDLVSAYLSRFG